jgi:hypothetical protein
MIYFVSSFFVTFSKCYYDQNCTVVNLGTVVNLLLHILHPVLVENMHSVTNTILSSLVQHDHHQFHHWSHQISMECSHLRHPYDSILSRKNGDNSANWPITTTNSFFTNFNDVSDFHVLSTFDVHVMWVNIRVTTDTKTRLYNAAQSATVIVNIRRRSRIFPPS